MDVVILAALRQELAPLERALRRPDVRIVRTGVGPVRAAEVARAAIGSAGLVISTGCCGGLSPELTAGSYCVPRRVLSQTASAVVEGPVPDPAWARRVEACAARLGPAVHTGPLVTVSNALWTAAAKHACRERTGAVAVDMETAAIAEVADELGVPFVSVRVVLDEASDALGEPGGPGRRPSLSKAVGQLRSTAGTALSVATRFRKIGEPLVPLIGALLEGRDALR